MKSFDFLYPVRIRVASDGEIVVIDDVRDMSRFLEAWPVERRGPVHKCAMNSCQAALAEQIPVEDARRSFVSFARITSILVDGGEGGAAGGRAASEALQMPLPH